MRTRSAPAALRRNGTTVHPGGTFVVGAVNRKRNPDAQGWRRTSGNGILQASGNYTWADPVTLNKRIDQQRQSDQPHADIHRAVTGTGGFYCCNGQPGALAFSNPGNTFSGASDS